MAIYHFILQGLHLFVPMVLAIGCVIYISKTHGIEGVLALVGVLGELLLGAVSLAASVLQSYGHWKPEMMSKIWPVVSILYLPASLLFAFAFVAMVYRIKIKSTVEE